VNGIGQQQARVEERGVTDDIETLAAACATHLRDTTAADGAALGRDFGTLLDRVRMLDPAFAFDREGRPGAIAAVREALPPQERDLLDAILEDHQCELAAVREAMRLIARAAARSISPP
jgi:hypothetical protein